MRKGMYQNFVFDLYGTLVDIHTREEDPAVWEKLALFYGYSGAVYTPGELKRAYEKLVQKQQSGKSDNKTGKEHEGYPEIQIDTVFEELYGEKGVETDEALILHTGQLFRALTTEYIRLYPGAKEMLERLRKAGKGVYLLSNAQRLFTLYELRMLGIEGCFDGIMISSEQRVKKPDIRFFRSLLDTYRLNPKESIMIGNDAGCDIEGAKRAGMDTYYIHSNLSPEGERDVEADYVQMEMDLDRVCRRLGIGSMLPK